MGIKGVNYVGNYAPLAVKGGPVETVNLEELNGAIGACLAAQKAADLDGRQVKLVVNLFKTWTTEKNREWFLNSPEQTLPLKKALTKICALMHGEENVFPKERTSFNLLVQERLAMIVSSFPKNVELTAGQEKVQVSSFLAIWRKTLLGQQVGSSLADVSIPMEEEKKRTLEAWGHYLETGNLRSSTLTLEELCAFLSFAHKEYRHRTEQIPYDLQQQIIEGFEKHLHREPVAVLTAAKKYPFLQEVSDRAFKENLGNPSFMELANLLDPSAVEEEKQGFICRLIQKEVQDRLGSIADVVDYKDGKLKPTKDATALQRRHIEELNFFAQIEGRILGLSIAFPNRSEPLKHWGLKATPFVRAKA